MRNLFHIAALISLLLVSPCVLNAQDKPDENAPNPYADAKGPEYAWPKRTQPLSISLKWEQAPEESRHQVFHITGEGIDIALNSISPFLIDDAVPPNPNWPGSVVLYDSRSQTGILTFTHFAKDEFLPDADKKTVAGYAKWLAGKTNVEKGAIVEIVLPPSDLSRKAAMIMTKPTFLTWKMSDRDSGARFQRTDYFFEQKDGSILVVSIVAAPEEEPAIRTSASQLLRFAYAVDQTPGSAQ